MRCDFSITCLNLPGSANVKKMQLSLRAQRNPAEAAEHQIERSAFLAVYFLAVSAIIVFQNSVRCSASRSRVVAEKLDLVIELCKRFVNAMNW
jgi:hypothetical protein